MINKIYELMVGRKDASGRTHWMKVGAAFPSKNGSDGFSIKLEVFPLPDERGMIWIQAFPPKDRDAPRATPANNARDRAPEDSEIPF